MRIGSETLGTTLTAHPAEYGPDWPRGDLVRGLLGNGKDSQCCGSASRVVRRLMDVMVSAILLVVSLPVQAVAALVVRLTSGKPVFYRQWRAGRGGRPIPILKFRTMQPNELPPTQLGQVSHDHELVTPAGRVLRRLKIDELPQLVAVVRGQMSLVGPRPALLEDAERYDAEQRRRLAVRPGLTGWAQVNGNTKLSWRERILLDVWYVDHWSPWLDMIVLAKTPAVLLRGERISAQAVGQAQEHADASRRRG